MRIVQISVRQLFGLQTFNYDIDLKTQERITIIHGPNGSGKTVLFKMISGLFNRQYSVFWRYPFQEFSVTMDKEATITVKRVYDAKHNQYRTPEISHSRFSKKFKLELNSDYLRYFRSSFRDRISPVEYDKVFRLFAEENTDSPFSSDSYEIQEIITRMGDELFTFLDREPAWLKSLQEKLKVSFIDTNRLLVNSPDKNTGGRLNIITPTAIIENSKHLSSRIKEKILQADTQAKLLDRTFPSRVVNSVLTGTKRIPNYDSIRIDLERLEEKRKRLTEAGLLEAGIQEAEFQIPERSDRSEQGQTLRSVLTMYIKDNNEKLEVYQELADKIELFKDIVQSMLRHKKIHISSKIGFQIQSDRGQPIPLEELSSGEQHLLVVIYSLLFQQSQHTDELILIDEPEISLHISWQKRFIDDLARINKLSGFDVVIATHSPAIINGRLDLMVGIQGATGEED